MGLLFLRGRSTPPRFSYVFLFTLKLYTKCVLRVGAVICEIRICKNVLIKKTILRMYACISDSLGVDSRKGKAIETLSSKIVTLGYVW